jgi:long-chain acyl-CoA synthetase
MATISGERQQTWAQFAHRIPLMAGALKSLGVKVGDRVAVLALNSDRYIELYFAIAWAGGVIVPLNTRWAIPENAYAIKDAESLVLFVDDEFVDQVAALRSECALRSVIYMGDSECPDGLLSYEAWVAGAQPVPDCCGTDDDLWGIYYTGGTTGFPKGVMLSQGNFVIAAISWMASLPLTEDTIYLHAAGIFHLAGAVPAVAVTLAGGTHVCIPKFDAVQTFKAIEKHRVNYVLFIPTMVNFLVNHPACGQYDLSSVRTCQYGGASMSDALIATVRQRLPTWQLTQSYGLTEVTSVTAVSPWKYHFETPEYTSKRMSAGRASYGMNIRIVDASGNEVPRGQVGEIAIRGPQVFLGYWRNPEATAAALRDGWLFTGDLASMDEDGFIFIADRAKDMIISGGENVYSREVENALSSHPAVSECAVIGVPDEHWGEKVYAVVVLRAGMAVTAEALVDHCRELIAGYKCPRGVEFRESLPISAAGKLMKGVLREEFRTGRNVLTR